jgi:hypothetical protein
MLLNLLLDIPCQRQSEKAYQSHLGEAKRVLFLELLPVLPVLRVSPGR